MTGDILGLIDGALEAWELSGDAMRWTAEPQPESRVLLDEVGSFAREFRLRQLGLDALIGTELSRAMDVELDPAIWYRVRR